MVKNIVFDFGGVIADLSRENAVKSFIRMGLLDADRRLDKYHQTGIFQELEEGKLSEEAYRAELEKLCGKSLTRADVQEAWMGFFTGVDIRRLHLLEQLREEGYRLYILSNTNPYVMGWACSDGFTTERKPLDAYFDKMYLSYKIGYTKPDSRIFEFMLKDSGMVPSETLFVDDGGSNIEMGEKMGMYTFQPVNASDWRNDLFLKINCINGIL
ncbi:HAD family phosphatase [uncultured Bacteroides sp.]|uniref:HAD family hydrolase n=1 Tax=uncultured Bacteroides sp. TaxID=162156 RepID=UPI00260CAEB7|nr:HAD family phosphatase [uncultured Bacteroides sp.]